MEITKSKNLLLLCFLILLLFSFSLIIYKNSFDNNFDNDLPNKKTQIIKKIKVISGHEYEITYAIQDRDICIEGKLPIKTKIESKIKVISLLNSITNPRLLIISKNNDFCIIEIIFQQNDKDVKISEWLKYNKLAYGE